jgi:hypothetical protein
MNGYTFAVFMIIVLLSACIMPTLADRMDKLEKQAPVSLPTHDG